MGLRRVQFGREHLLLMAIFGLSFISLNLGFRYLGSGDTTPHELLAVSVLQEFDLDFNEFVDSSEPEDLRYLYRNVDGRIVSIYPILPGLMNLPVYSLARLGGLDVFEHRLALSKLTATVLVSLSAVFMFLLMRLITGSGGSALLLSAVYLFGTCVWSVASMAMWQHTGSLFFLSGALFLLWSAPPPGRPGSHKVWLAGLLLGLAVWGRPTNILIAAPLALVVLLRYRKNVAGFAAAFAVPLAFMELYSLVYWNDLLALGQGHRAGQFNANPLHAFMGLLFSANRGLFVFSPVLIFGAVELVRRVLARGTEPLIRGLGISFFLVLGLYSFWGQWWGGYCFGYRLLLETVPIVMVFMALGFGEVTRGGWPMKGLFGLLALVSVFVHWLGAVWYPQGFNMHPNSINLFPERLWDFSDGELMRCVRKMWVRWF